MLTGTAIHRIVKFIWITPGNVMTIKRCCVRSHWGVAPTFCWSLYRLFCLTCGWDHSDLPPSDTPSQRTLASYRCGACARCNKQTLYNYNQKLSYRKPLGCLFLKQTFSSGHRPTVSLPSSFQFLPVYFVVTFLSAACLIGQVLDFTVALHVEEVYCKTHDKNTCSGL